MAQQNSPTNSEEDRRKPKSRLTNMVTQEVSLVDRAANLRRFVLLKRCSEMDEIVKEGSVAEAAAVDDAETAPNPTAEQAVETQKSLALPAAAKQAILDGLASALEKLTALATAVGEANADDSAEVPPELATAFMDCGKELVAMGEAYAPAPAAAAADAPPAADASQASPPDAAQQKAHDEVSKAGRKIAGARLSQIKQAFDLLAAVLGDVTSEQEPAQKNDAQSVIDEQKQLIAKQGKQLEELAVLLKAQSARIAAQEARLGNVLKSAPVSNSMPVEGRQPPSATPVVWPHDMSAAVAAKLAQQRNKI